MHSSNEAVNLVGILDAFEGLAIGAISLNARAHING